MDQPQNTPSGHSTRWVHYLAIGTACATFPLIVVGGLVTSIRVGMADTAWPTAPWYFVWLVWVGRAMDSGLGFLIEHGHRQLGWLVGLLKLILAIGLWTTERRPWLRWLGVAAIVGVIGQGVLGGLRVIFVNQFMALVHGVFAQIFFALLVAIAVFTGRRWSAVVPAVESAGAGRLQRLSAITTGLIILQLVLGAALRHFGFTWALVTHLFVAFAIVVHVALMAKRIFVEFAGERRLTKAIEVLGMLVLGQIMLGVAAWGTSAGFGLDLTTAPSGAQVFFATAHMAVGSLIMASSTLLTVQSRRLLVPAPDLNRGDRSRTRSKGAPATRPYISSLDTREHWSVEASS